MSDAAPLLPASRPVCEKDLSVVMDCLPRTVKRWWRKLRCPPDLRDGGRGARNLWTPAGAEHFIRQWQNWWQQRGFDPLFSTKKFAGAKPARDNQQLTFEFRVAGGARGETSPKSPARGGSKKKPATRPRSGLVSRSK